MHEKRKRIDISDSKKMEIEKKVSSILVNAGLEEETVVDIVSLVKNDHFLVQSGDLPIDTTGYLAVNDNEPIDEENQISRLIVVNNKFRNPDREENVVLKKSRFITAHEYGHFILHKLSEEPLYAHRDSDKRDTEEELEADYFARSILMPAKIFLEIVDVINKVSEEMMNDKGNCKEKDFYEKLKIEFLSKYFKVTQNKVIKRLEDVDFLRSMLV